MIPAHEGTGGVSGDSGGGLDRRPGSGFLAEGRCVPPGGRVLHDDDPSRYLNDTSAVHDDDSAAHDDDRASVFHHRHYDGAHHYRGVVYNLYSDAYLVNDGPLQQYDDRYDLDNYRPDDDD